MAEQIEDVLLVDALREKYCPAEKEDVCSTENDEVREIARSCRPGAVPARRLSVVILERAGITHSGPGDELTELCPAVQELSLGGNSISGWETVWTIVSSMPQLQMLDLARNPSLSCSSPMSTFTPCLSLRALVLNHTGVPFASIVTISQLLPNLSELHLFQNGYSDSHIEETTISSSSCPNSSLTRLHIGNNSISKWETFQQLSLLFPNLECLVAIANPISCVCANTQQHFPKLKLLNLNETEISTWDSIQCLSDLISLTDFSLLKVPLGSDLSEKHRRFATIARMPLLTRLNKSTVDGEEREDAERWLVRQFDGQPDHTRPKVYNELKVKHGIINQLAVVDLSPKRKASLEFHFEDKPIETHTVLLKQTTKQLKSWICKNLLGVPSCKLMLLYGDTECLETFGLQRMRYDNKNLMSYRMKDGDQIHVTILSE